MSEEGNAEKLMNALISKMESMDSTIQNLQAENTLIKKHMANPTGLLKKMGFVSVKTPFAEDVTPDVFRGGPEDIMKGDIGNEIPLPTSNEDFHTMDWGAIHELADSAKDTGNLGNPMPLE
jgi:hypothetical protein